MKKILALVLALCMIFALCACGQSAAPAEQPAKNEAPAADGAAPAEDAAVEEDLGDTLVLYSSMTEADLDALKTCFNEVYPDIEIEVISGSAGEFTAKIQAEAGNPQGDVTWGGLADSDGDKYAEIFEAWVSDNDDEQMEGYSTPNGFYSMDHLSTVCFCVNTELEKELGLNIQSYEDLLDPALKGKIVFSDPNSSSAAWNNLCNIFSVYGIDTDEAWDYIDALLENMVVVEKSSVCFNSVSDGEYVVGLTYEDGAIKLNRAQPSSALRLSPRFATPPTALPPLLSVLRSSRARPTWRLQRLSSTGSPPLRVRAPWQSTCRALSASPTPTTPLPRTHGSRRPATSLGSPVMSPL